MKQIDSTNRWFVCPQIRPEAEMRLFLFPHAGAGVAAFNKWASEFPPTIEVFIAHYPGRGSRQRESPIKRVVTLAESFSQAIQPILDLPFALFGHSLGGLVVFELARHLQRNSFPQPRVLFISGCSAPHVPNAEPSIHSLPDVQFLLSLQERNSIPSEFFGQPEIMQLLLPALRADFEAVETYGYHPDQEPLHCPIVVFGGEDDPRASHEGVEGWTRHTDSRFLSHYFPGDHFFLHTAREAMIASIVKELTTVYAKN
jgi:medium-chain acyl-[acyl-carrier-protein] hydrolase